ncbi:MAG: NAD(P)-dependent oxidoreductase, partial [Alphaproteobacteria bacterium]|nr:NAD(P)-dependent oxidoreductase [Alphaproteobacteria bacterium]
VHALVYPPFAPEQKNLIQHEMNLMDSKAVDEFLSEHNFENLIHLAWYVGKSCHIHNFNLDWTIATLNLIKSFVENGGKCFVGAGTVSEYEYKYGYLIEDQTPTDPQTLYGNSKNAIFNIAKVYCKQNACKFKWPRIFNLYGPNEKPQRLMPSVINSCLKNEDVKVSDCLKFQDYLHVEDTARGIVDVFENEIEGAINICSGMPVQLRYIVNKIAEYTNFKGQILWGAVPAAFGDDLVVGNNEKLKSVGWKPKYSLEDGLKQTINWWRENNV